MGTDIKKERRAAKSAWAVFRSVNDHGYPEQFKVPVQFWQLTEEGKWVGFVTDSAEGPKAVTSYTNFCHYVTANKPA